MKQKTLLYTLLIAMCGFFAVSCSDDDDDAVKFYYPNSEGKEVRTNDITIYLDLTAMVRVEGVSNEFDVSFSDPELIATVTCSDDNFVIVARKTGTTTLMLTDSNGKTASMQVTVVARETRLELIEAFTDVTASNSTAENEAEIADMKKNISARLLSIGDSYKLTYEQGERGLVDVYKKDLRIPFRSGTFVIERNYDENKITYVMTFKDEVVTYYFATSYLHNRQLKSSEIRPAYFIQDYSHLYGNYPNVKFEKARGVECLRVSFLN